MIEVLLALYALGIFYLTFFVAMPIVAGEPTDHGYLILLPTAIAMVAFWPFVLAWLLLARLVDFLDRRKRR